MRKIFLLSILLSFGFFAVYAQNDGTVKKDSAANRTDRVDTLKSTYVNIGKIQARKAAIRSLMLPGLGQIRNGVTVYRIAKVAAIYTGATLLTLSFIENNKSYHTLLDELKYRQENNDTPLDVFYSSYPTSRLLLAKDSNRRNKEVVIFSLVALYLVNSVEAYIDARLKYFDIGDDLAFKITPGTVFSGNTYGYNSFAPALKLSLRL